MSFLAWAFAFAALGVSFPFIFHLIRKTPRGRQEFSSLMFLKPSPPRITRRSRLDNWLLLFIRATVIVLLALAFMRPFVRESAYFSAANFTARHVAIVVDTSASMQRAAAWNKAQNEVEQVLRQLQPSDDVALFTFDSGFETIVGFDRPDDSSVLLSQKSDMVRNQLRGLSPGWGATNLGAALVETAQRLEAAADDLRENRFLQIELISDMQSGASIEALQAYQWPPNIMLNIRRVAVSDTSNASVRLLEQAGEEEDSESYRVRVYNDAQSNADQFFVSWRTTDREELANQIPFYVAPGASRILNVPRVGKSLASDRLVLRGDASSFDNEFFVAPVEQQEYQVDFIGPESEETADGLFYYLLRCFVQSDEQRVKVRRLEQWNSNAWQAEGKPDWVVVSRQVTPQELTELQKYLSAQGSVLLVLQSVEQAESLKSLSHSEPLGQPTEVDFALLAEIDFEHPLFSIFSTPQYSDFTNIHFWDHLPLRLTDGDPVQVLARFDTGDPAMWQIPHGSGRVLCMACGWQPESSELALSTKFVPLMNVLLKSGGNNQLPMSTRLVVNEPFELPMEESREYQVIRPDGSVQILTASERFFRATDMPGLYTVQSDADRHLFAVNVAAAESQTAPANQDRLEAFQVQVGKQPKQTEQAASAQRIRDAELERQQKIWEVACCFRIGSVDHRDDCGQACIVVATSS